MHSIGATINARVANPREVGRKKQQRPKVRTAKRPRAMGVPKRKFFGGKKKIVKIGGKKKLE